jgi:hypothetical protein
LAWKNLAYFSADIEDAPISVGTRIWSGGNEYSEFMVGSYDFSAGVAGRDE